MQTRTRILTALPFLLMLATGCGPRPIDHEHTLVPGMGHHPGLSSVLLIPINETEKIPAGLDVADDVIESLVAEYLESKGLTVDRIGKVEYRRSVRVAIDAVEKNMLSGETGSTSGSVAYSDVVPLLLEELSSGAQLVVVPNVAMRAGEYTGGRSIKWDGVRRKEKIGAGSTMSGEATVASLHSLVFDRKGKLIFSAYGGLDAIFETNIREKRYDVKADLFQNEEYLAEGICISFHPFFGIEEEC